MTIMKENLCFKEMRLNYLSKQQKTKAKKEQLRLVINSVRVGVVSSVLEQLTFVLLVSF